MAQDTNPVQEQTDQQDITEGGGNESVQPGEQFIPEDNEAPAESSIIEDRAGWTYGLLVFAALALIGGAFAYVLVKQKPRH